MPGAAYNTRRAAEQNAPIELYEIHLLNGVIIHLTNTPEDQTATTPDAPNKRFLDAWGNNPSNYFDFDFSAYVDQPLLNMGPNFPFRMTALHSAYTEVGDVVTRSHTGGIFTTSSNVPCSIQVAATPEIPYASIEHSFLDGSGWSNPCLAFEGADNPQEHWVWQGDYNSAGVYYGRSIILSSGVPGAMSEPAYILQGFVDQTPPPCVPCAPGYVHTHTVCEPAVMQYVTYEGEEEVEGGGVVWAPQYSGTPEYKYAIMYCASWQSASQLAIGWTGKNGLHTGITNFDAADIEALWWPDPADPDKNWCRYALRQPFAFREVGSDKIHVFMTGCPLYDATTPPHYSYTGVGYNRYDCTSGTWEYAFPVCVLGGDYQVFDPVTDLFNYAKPIVYKNPIDGRFYLVVQKSKPPGGGYIATYVNDDIEDEDGWVEYDNAPPDEAFGDDTLAGPNIFSIYSNDSYAQTYWTFPVKRENIKRTSGDSVNTCTIYFSNVEHHFTGLLSVFDLRMSRVVIKRSFADLDIGDPDNVVTIFEGVIDEYGLTKDYLRVVAKETLLNWDAQFPKRCYSTCCSFAFKGYGCGYGGPESYCDKTFETCTYYGNENNFGGFIDAAVAQRRHTMQKYIPGGKLKIYA